MTGELPDLFLLDDGRCVRTADDWHVRRGQMLAVLQEIEYGHLPPAPPRVEGELLMRNRAGVYGGARQFMYRLRCGHGSDAGSVAFVLDVYLPAGDGPFPAIIDGDACWPVFTPEIVNAVLGHGYALALFNRLQIAGDNKQTGRRHGIYDLYPGGDFGALAAWAWGYSRAADFLSTLEFIRADQLIAIGASRGGKTALLAGAADERFALTVANGSGCCGAGCFRHLGPGAETLDEMLDHAAFWLSPRLAEFLGREHELPFDQHFLKALVAPRRLLTTEALADHYANPTGTWLTHTAAREAWRFLGVEDRIGIRYRPGEHAHKLEDFQAALEFADWQFRGQPADEPFDRCPFADLPRAFTWSAPKPA